MTWDMMNTLTMLAVARLDDTLWCEEKVCGFCLDQWDAFLGWFLLALAAFFFGFVCGLDRKRGKELVEEYRYGRKTEEK